MAVVREKPRMLYRQTDVTGVISEGEFNVRAASGECQFQLHVAVPIYLSVQPPLLSLQAPGGGRYLRGVEGS